MSELFNLAGCDECGARSAVWTEDAHLDVRVITPAGCNEAGCPGFRVCTVLGHVTVWHASDARPTTEGAE